ncbi:MAG: serpin family protein [Anaerolineales bacterium]
MQLFWSKKQQNDQASLVAAMQGTTEFALDLYRNLRATEGNLFFSPYSISAALAMTYAGARADTQTQMAHALHFLPDQKQLHPAFALLAARLEEAGKKGHVQLSAANTLWPRTGYTFLKEFLNLAKKFYGVQITPVDYDDEEAARNTINKWVEEKTEGKIKDLIASGVLDSATRLVLVNAIYFKGEWGSQFDPRLTSQAPFMVASGEPVQVPMMTCKHAFKYTEDSDLQILELRYAGDDLTMLETEVDVYLPRFELSFPFRLDDTLKSMGMVYAFSDQADFSGMDGSQELYLGAVLHKAFVAVEEQGTEAAAATAAIMTLKAISFSPVAFRADHPFVFLIREKSTGCILFIGRVVNPL